MKCEFHGQARLLWLPCVKGGSDYFFSPVLYPNKRTRQYILPPHPGSLRSPTFPSRGRHPRCSTPVCCPRRFCAAPEVRRMPQGGFADRRLLNLWGPHQNEVFMGNASAPTGVIKAIEYVFVRACAEQIYLIKRGPHGRARGEYAIIYVFAATCARQIPPDPRAFPQKCRETAARRKIC